MTTELKDFRKFLWLAWKRLGLPQPTPVQVDFSRFIDRGPDPTVPCTRAPNNRLMGEAFRGMGKSWILVAFAVHQLMLNPQLKILIVSASKTAASDMTTFLLELLELMPETRHLIPEGDQRQSRIAFDVRPATPAKQPSVKSVGIFGQIVGSRADLIIADDVETDNNAATQGGRERLRQAIRQFDAVLSPGGRIVYLGTPQTEESIYNDLPERGYRVRIWPARYPQLPPEAVQRVGRGVAKGGPSSHQLPPSDSPADGPVADSALEIGVREGLVAGRGEPLGAVGVPGVPSSSPQLDRLESPSPGIARELGLRIQAAAGGWFAQLSPMIVRDLVRDPSIHGTPTDPLRFPDDDLLAREASWGRSGFALQYMLDTRLSDANRYPLKLSDLIVQDLDPEVAPSRLVWARGPDLEIQELPCVGFDGDRYHRPMSLSDELAPYEGSVMFVDPSGKGSDETALAVVKMLHGQLFAAEVKGLGISAGYEDAVLQDIAKTAKAHGCHRILVENNFGQGMFAQLLRPVLNRLYPCTIEEVRRGSVQKERRIIETLEPVMNQHRLIVDRRVVERDAQVDQALGDRASSYQLFHQLTRITLERGCLAHDDRLDALAGAVEYWTDRMARNVDQAAHDRRERIRQARFKRHLEHQISGPLGGTPRVSRPSHFASYGVRKTSARRRLRRR